MSQSYKNLKNGCPSICGQCLKCCEIFYFPRLFTFYIVVKLWDKTHTHAQKQNWNKWEGKPAWVNASAHLKHSSLSSARLTPQKHSAKTWKKLFKNWGTERKGGHQKIFFQSKKITLTGNKLNLLRYSRVIIFIESFLDYQPICC